MMTTSTSATVTTTVATNGNITIVILLVVIFQWENSAFCLVRVLQVLVAHNLQGGTPLRLDGSGRPVSSIGEYPSCSLVRVEDIRAAAPSTVPSSGDIGAAAAADVATAAADDVAGGNVGRMSIDRDEEEETVIQEGQHAFREREGGEKWWDCGSGKCDGGIHVVTSAEEVAALFLDNDDNEDDDGGGEGRGGAELTNRLLPISPSDRRGDSAESPPGWIMVGGRRADDDSGDRSALSGGRVAAAVSRVAGDVPGPGDKKSGDSGHGGGDADGAGHADAGRRDRSVGGGRDRYVRLAAEHVTAFLRTALLLVRLCMGSPEQQQPEGVGGAGGSRGGGRGREEESGGVLCDGPIEDTFEGLCRLFEFPETAEAFLADTGAMNAARRCVFFVFCVVLYFEYAFCG